MIEKCESSKERKKINEISWLTDDGDSDGADLPSCEFRTRIKLEISARDEPLPLDRNKCEF